MAQDLYDFAGAPDSGADPWAGLVLLGNTMYGTANSGGSFNRGTVFEVNTDGTGYTNVHSFTGGDGANPYAGLTISGNTLYGTTWGGGSSGNGTVFAVNIDGTGFTNLHSFALTGDGANPYGGLILLGNTLYGTASGGDSSGNGRVFAVNTDSTGYTNLHKFAGYPDEGASPYGGLILSGNTLYGTTYSGGSSGWGTVFSLSLGSVSAPQLTIILSGANVILTWPTNAAGFTLQSTTNLGASALWNTNSPAPVVVNGRNTVTNPISVTQQFFRLSQ